MFLKHCITRFSVQNPKRYLRTRNLSFASPDIIHSHPPPPPLKNTIFWLYQKSPLKLLQVSFGRNIAFWGFPYFACRRWQVPPLACPRRHDKPSTYSSGELLTASVDNLQPFDIRQFPLSVTFTSHLANSVSCSCWKRISLLTQLLGLSILELASRYRCREKIREGCCLL